MRIDVTAEDIALGAPEDACECPVALAIKRVCPGRIPWVDNVGLDWEEGDALMPGPALPEEVNAFIRRFDKGEPVEPFSFELDLP